MLPCAERARPRNPFTHLLNYPFTKLCWLAVMPKPKARSLRCPACRTLVLATDQNFPFCSDRCRLIDLGKWASGGYVISTKINDPEQLEDLAEQQSRQKADPDGHSSEQ